MKLFFADMVQQPEPRRFRCCWFFRMSKLFLTLALVAALVAVSAQAPIPMGGLDGTAAERA
jgi:hypothetical protein